MFGFGGHGKPGGPFGGPPWAQRMRRMGGGACGGPFALLANLDLTDDQIEQLAEVKVQGLASFAQFKSTTFRLIQQIGKELTKDQIDKTQVKEIAQQIKAQKSEFADDMLDRILTVCEILSVEQRKKVRRRMLSHFLGIDSPPAPPPPEH